MGSPLGNHEWTTPELKSGWATAGQLRKAAGISPPTVFTLPEGYRPLERPRHYLVIHPPQPGRKPREREWEVEHDPTCPYEYRYGFTRIRDSVHYLCEVADQVGYNGLDYLDADWAALSAGRYEIEAWHTEYDDGYDPRECEHGLRVVRRCPQLTTVVSV